MGVNAQTTVPKFTAGQVLTAAQQTAINTGIPVFATTTTRDAAFGGSNKVLAEGQMAYIEATDTTQYYDGAAWQTLSATPGLRYITGASFSAVSSVSLPNNSFSSTYRNYRLMLNITNMSTTMTITSRLRASGTDNTTSNYYYSNWSWSVSGSGISGQGTTQTAWTIAVQDTGTYRYGNFNVDLMSPQLAENTIAAGTAIGPGASGYPQYWSQSIFTGLFASTTQFDSLSIIASTGNITGVYRLYGYSES